MAVRMTVGNFPDNVPTVIRTAIIYQYDLSIDILKLQNLLNLVYSPAYDVETVIDRYNDRVIWGQFFDFDFWQGYYSRIFKQIYSYFDDMRLINSPAYSNKK